MRIDIQSFLDDLQIMPVCNSKRLADVLALAVEQPTLLETHRLFYRYAVSNDLYTSTVTAVVKRALCSAQNTALMETLTGTDGWDVHPERFLFCAVESLTGRRPKLRFQLRHAISEDDYDFTKHSHRRYLNGWASSPNRWAADTSAPGKLRKKRYMRRMPVLPTPICCIGTTFALTASPFCANCWKSNGSFTIIHCCKSRSGPSASSWTACTCALRIAGMPTWSMPCPSRWKTLRCSKAGKYGRKQRHITKYRSARSQAHWVHLSNPFGPRRPLQSSSEYPAATPAITQNWRLRCIGISPAAASPFVTIFPPPLWKRTFKYSKTCTPIPCPSFITPKQTAIILPACSIGLLPSAAPCLRCTTICGTPRICIFCIGTA